MGWNDLQVNPDAKLFSGFEPQPRFYFLHSYYFDCDDKADVAATATYGFEFPCVVSKSHIHGVQCHPEKSHHFGAQLLKNFAEL
jgi:glutamine amidotransferase